MLRVEANFIYQRKGYYEIILNKIAEKERNKESSKGRDELKERVAQQERFGSGGLGGGGGFGGFAPQHVNDKRKEEEKKAEDELSYIDKVLKLFESMVLEENKEAQVGEDVRINEQAKTMLKSIFAYWCVFSLRFVDNLHQRVKFNMLFRFVDGLMTKVGTQFMPGGGSEDAERVRQWMEEPPHQATIRQKFTTELSKVNECQEIISQMSSNI